MANRWGYPEEVAKNEKKFLENLKIKNPIVYNEYKILSSYHTIREKIKVLCPNGHEVWEVSPKDLLKNHHCPKCNISKGENDIKIIVENMGLKYITQYSVPDLLGKYKRDGSPATRPSRLRFDGFIPEYNILIEYQGEHHYTFIPKYCSNGLMDFRICMEYDMMKEQYANKKGYKYVIIPYTERDNVEGIICTAIREVNIERLQMHPGRVLQ